MMPAKEKTTTHVSTFDLDRVELGALDDEKKQAIEAHVQACVACREEQETLRRDRARFSNEVFPRTAMRVRGRLHQRRPWYARPWVWAPVLAGAAGLVLLLGRPSTRAPSDDQAIHTKGSTELLLIARQSGRVFTIDRFNHELHAGDEIRFVVTQTDSTHPFLLIASIDGRGQASVYFPYRGQKSGRIDRPGRWEVPGSIVLDGSPGPERFFALFSHEPLDAVALTARLAGVARGGWDAIRRTSDLDWPGVEQRSMVIEKSSTP